MDPPLSKLPFDVLAPVVALLDRVTEPFCELTPDCEASNENSSLCTGSLRGRLGCVRASRVGVGCAVRRVCMLAESVVEGVRDRDAELRA